ncbi:GNAT family N-acetyltransferase [Muriicola soli]|uniref:GNAT family N-acetyltransferase n=1 Tax=Muriicola soli TaxID=2507538 RepID=A0A411E9I7_9FLAO|nr:GNAT family N-acetyltransferase [Muriicola soli]QBA64395.1 GNAT family N-acetyltransferase [Muriicola soli]
MSPSIKKATQDHIPDIAPLLDAYRVFYNQPSDLPAAEEFLKARFTKQDSDLFLAYCEEKPAGFVQLYSSFSTVSLRPVYILNDLFVAPEFRKKGIGIALLKEAQEFCRKREFKGLALETAVDNPAQALYEKLGWEKDVHCFHYFWTAR